MSLFLATSLHAQKVTVSSPTKPNDEGVTVKVNDNGENVSIAGSTGLSGTANKGDDLPKDMPAADKAKRIAKAINDAGDNTREDGTKRVTATASGADVSVAGSSGVTVKSIKVNSNTGEKSDKLKWSAANTMFTATVVGVPTLYDGCGDPSVFRIGTARGVVEIPLASSGTIQQTLVMAADGLAQYGISAWMPTSNSIAFVVDHDLDTAAHYGCSDFGLEQIFELAVIPGDDEADSDG
ncbi:MAG: hypothetical protein EPO68_17165 [Planctomycetota bacterium]|nr:MAG: hypothetical protein EPO68_17165 [Planctomycetota bacterium]